jgi:subtilisin family serine protease
MAVAATAAPPKDRLAARSQQLPGAIEQLRLPTPLQAEAGSLAIVDPALQEAEGRQRVIVRLRSPSVAKYRGKSQSARVGHKSQLKNEQSAFVKRASRAAPSSRKMAGVQTVLNAVFLEVDAKEIDKLAADRDVVTIHRVKDYEMDLSETVPYIGASAVQSAGYDGTGIRVAVLDSGVDYYHANLGGSGNPLDYLADDPTIIEPGTFPTAKVVDGYDFVGSVWPGGAEAPDPDPLDDGSAAGHGTHVADIIGGTAGVAPGADIYAVKVCSSVSSSCSGIALIQGMDFAVDPNGDGDPSDAVDIINMSLGSSYGQPFDDDLSLAVNNATGLGVLTVSSAGNGSNKPYVTGTASSEATALSVAQTQVPSAALQLIDVDGVGYPGVFQTWSGDLVATVGPTPVAYGGDFGSNLGCSVGGNPNSILPGTEPFPPGTFSGEIVLVDRGVCNFSIKIFNIQRGGGAVGIIGLVAPGAPFNGALGAGENFLIPGFMISQADSNAIKAQIGNPGIGTVDPSSQLPLVGMMVGSSSRGPQHESTTLIKPEIGAPGASISAIAGTGILEGAFGGTSGASPMVAGSAALLLQAHSDLSPLEVKARLMNNGETNIDTDPFTGLAPITRIGGGEVRVDRALAAPAAAWDDDVPQGALSFGFVDVPKDTVVLHKTVRVRNYSEDDIRYSVTPTFRDQGDADNGAVSVSVPNGKVFVKAGRDATIPVKMTIQGAYLRGNYMNSGSQGANPAALTLNEYDGYLVLDDGSHPIHLAWHVLPRQAANVVGRQVLNTKRGQDVVSLTNNGVGTAQNDAYALLAVSPNQPEGGLGEQMPTPDIRAVGINTFPVPAGFCSGEPSFIWAFAINSWERQQHLLPVKYFVYLDIDQDGADDYVVLNNDLSVFSTGSLGTISDGRQLSLSWNLGASTIDAFFFAEHSTNTGNTVLLICGEQVGLTGTDMLNTNVDVRVEAFDFYYGGPGDVVDDLTVTPLGEQYLGLPGDIAAGQVGSMDVLDFGPFPGNTPELGIMLITNGDRGTGARGGATQATEAMLFEAK